MTTLTEKQSEIMAALGRIAELAYKISACTKADIFLWTFPHTNTIQVDYFPEGWSRSNEHKKITKDVACEPETLCAEENELLEIWEDALCAEICDSYCKYAACSDLSQEELDEKCDNCPMGELGARK